MSSAFHKVIISNLINNPDYFKSVLPYLKPEYFEDKPTSVIFDMISTFAAEYKKQPTYDVLEIQIEDVKGLSQQVFDETKDLLKEIKKADKDVDRQWLLDSTEKYCQEKAIYLAILDAVSIIDGSDKKRAPGAIPSLLSEALAVSFDKRVGHDYFEDMESRRAFYTTKEAKIPFMIPILDKVTYDGIIKKSLNLLMAVSNGGKSAAMCSLAASYIAQGYNVLYITLELAEERVAERIDANLLNLPINLIKEVPKDLFVKKLTKIKEKSYGKLILKEYPTKGASVNHFRTLLDELKLKKDFEPDIVFVDYLGICASAHYKSGSGANSYTEQKSVAEELRGLAVERNLAIWSAVQANRSGYNNSDMSETSIAESIGILMTADFVLGLIRTPELDEAGHVLVKQLKSRYGDIATHNKFLLGFDRPRMKLFSVDQIGISNDSPPKSQEEEHMGMLSEKSKSLESKLKGTSDGWSYD